MKKLILFGLVVVLFTSCQKKEPQRYFSKSQEIDVVKTLIKDYQNGDWEAWASHYADTAKIYQNSIESSSVQEIKKSLKDILSNVSSYKFSEKKIYYEMIIDDDQEIWVNFWGNWKGKLAANDKELIIPVHLTFQFIDNKIIEEYSYFNVAEFTAALQEIEAAKLIKEATSEN